MKVSNVKKLKQAKVVLDNDDLWAIYRALEWTTDTHDDTVHAVRQAGLLKTFKEILE